MLFAATTLVGPSALAQPREGPSTDDRARAQQLFEAALADIEKGDVAGACPKFLSSQRADPKTSTLLNLANCYERNGQTASAWGAFKEGELSARKVGREDWAKTAADRALALDARLVRLTVLGPRASPAGLEIKRDRAVLLSGELGVAIPVDPGEHVIEAHAPGFREWQAKVVVTDGSQVVQVGALEAEPVAPKPPPPPDAVTPAPAPRFWSTPRIAGAGVAGVGVIAVGVGAIFALSAKSTYDDAKAECASGNKGCPPQAVTRADDAFNRATLATVFIAGGGALVAGGAAVFLLFPPSKSSSGLLIVPAPGGAAAVGRF